MRDENSFNFFLTRLRIKIAFQITFHFFLTMIETTAVIDKGFCLISFGVGFSIKTTLTNWMNYTCNFHD